jgi:DNA-binding transcriptional LysR family regulator
MKPRIDPPLTRRIDITSLQLFAAVCELGSIGKAAEREFIAASAVSKRLSDLEAALGTSLLHRHSRGVDLTPAGTSLLHHARNVILSLDKMQSELAEYADGVRGHVRVLASISAIVQFLPEDLGAFSRAHEHIKVDLEERLSSDVIRGVSEGAADLGVCNTSHGVGELQSLPYRRDHLMVVFHKKHALNRHVPSENRASAAINFESILDFDHVGLHSHSSIQLAMRRAAAACAKPLKLRMTVTGLDAMCRMIHNGLGVGLIPNRAFDLMHHMGDLVALPLSDAWAQRRIDLVARDFTSLSPTARALAQHLSAEHLDPPRR